MPNEPTLGQYVIGVEGLALLRTAFTDDAAGRAARTREVRELSEQVDGEPSWAAPLGTEFDLTDGYRRWSATYDRPLRLFSVEEPPMMALIDGLEPGTVLDAACGTGRYSGHLADRGHHVIGVDQSEDMLAIARGKLPQAEFRRGDLRSLPVADQSVDAVVCALALVHVSDLTAAMAEFGRVLRPGGRLIVSDVHPFLVLLGWQAQFPLGDEHRGFMRLHCHLASDYVTAAGRHGLALRTLSEPPLTEASALTAAAEIVPEANRDAFVGLPAVFVWGFERTAGEPSTEARAERRAATGIREGG